MNTLAAATFLNKWKVWITEHVDTDYRTSCTVNRTKGTVNRTPLPLTLRNSEVILKPEFEGRGRGNERGDYRGESRGRG
jgi:hypothetical protein